MKINDFSKKVALILLEKLLRIKEFDKIQTNQNI